MPYANFEQQVQNVSTVLEADDRETINLYKQKMLEQYKKKIAEVDVFQRINTPPGPNNSPKKEKKEMGTFLDKLNVLNERVHNFQKSFASR